MPLIPGTLPSDTCYGTPQQLLQLFAQYLDIPAFSVSSKVLYSDTSPSPVNDLLWVDTPLVGATTPKFKVYNRLSSLYEEYPFGGGRTTDVPPDPVNYDETLISGKSEATSLVANDFLLLSQFGANRKLRRILFSNVVLSAVASTNFVVTYPKLSSSATVSDNVTARTVKAWVNFDGGAATPIAPRSSFNVSSVVRNALGQFTISFSNAMPNINYAPFVFCESAGASPATTVPIVCRSTTYAGGTPLAGSFTLYFNEAQVLGGNAVNPKLVSFMVVAGPT